MAVYLSPAWFEDVNRAAAADDGLRAATAGARITLQQVVTGSAAGDIHYWVKVDDGTVEVAVGDADNPDVTVTQTYETATAVGQGELSVENALLAGRARVGGDLGTLAEHQKALQELAAVLGKVHSRTEYH